jgi:hypothetical protein
VLATRSDLTTVERLNQRQEELQKEATDTKERASYSPMAEF